MQIEYKLNNNLPHIVVNHKCINILQDAGSGQMMYIEGEEEDEECRTPTGEDTQAQQFVIPDTESQPQHHSQDIGNITLCKSHAISFTLGLVAWYEP